MSAESLVLDVIGLAVKEAPAVIDAIRAWATGTTDESDPVHVRAKEILDQGLLGLSSKVEELKRERSNRSGNR